MIRAFNGKTPKIAESAFVSESAYVVGDVEIGEGSGVWPGAVVRGDFGPVKIGRNSQVEDNSVVHVGSTSMEIGDDVIIAHGVVVHCSRIGNQVLIGNNATILDDAVIGDNCIIGANSMVSTSQKIPDNSLVVGAPAKVKRPISPAEIENLRAGLRLYADMMRKYKQARL